MPIEEDVRKLWRCTTWDTDKGKLANNMRKTLLAWGKMQCLQPSIADGAAQQVSIKSKERHEHASSADMANLSTSTGAVNGTRPDCGRSKPCELLWHHHWDTAEDSCLRDGHAC